MTYYESYANGVTCLLCEHYCFLVPGQIGPCYNQQNVGGELRTITFGAPAALSITHVEDRPFLHFLPGSTALTLGTAGCNMHCPHCQNHRLTQTPEANEPLSLPPAEVVKLAIENRADAVAFGFSEPAVFYPYAKAIGIIARDKGLRTMMSTSGLTSSRMLEDMRGWVDAVHVDLKSFDPAYYQSVLGGSLASVKETLRTLARSGIWLEISTLVLERVNDSDAMLESMAAFIADELGREIPWHLSAMVPSYRMAQYRPTPSSALLRAFEIAKAAGLAHVYFGNVPWLNETCCAHCGARLLLRDDYTLLETRLDDGRCPECATPLKGIFT